MAYIKQQGANVVVINADEDVQGFYDAMPDKEQFEIIEGDAPEDAQQLIYQPQ